jgi:predicted Zn-dependent protease
MISVAVLPVRILRSISVRARAALAVVLCATLIASPAQAQEILRDAETEALLHDAAAPLIKAAGLDPRNVEVLLIQDPSVNAFVAGGQTVWIHTGLIAEADNVNQVQGVIAHELGHIEGGHVIRSAEGMKEATGITLLSLVLGAAAIAAGGAEAGMGILAAGQQAALGKYLAFSRTQESSADLAGARYLHTAGISGRGTLEFFKKLQNMEYRYRVAEDADGGYATTHPMSGDRIAVLTDLYKNDAAWSKPTDPALEARFERIKAKLIGYVSDPPVTLRKYPETDRTMPGYYARAYAYHKGAYPDQALACTDALLKSLPDDPYFLELKGQILLESGRPADAVGPLRRAVAGTNENPLISAMLGHALVATDDDHYLDEAEHVLRTALGRDRDNPFGWYVLGNVYARKGDNARAALASAEQANLSGDAGGALRQAQTALATLKPGTNDYLRAQDIAMVSRAAMDKRGGKKKKSGNGPGELRLDVRQGE